LWVIIFLQHPVCSEAQCFEKSSQSKTEDGFDELIWIETRCQMIRALMNSKAADA